MAGVADKNAVKAGAFIIGTLVLIVAIFLAVEGVGAFVGRDGRWVVRFALSEDVSGLAVGDEVRVGGVRRGSVRRVTFADDYSHVLVEVALPREVPVRQEPSVQVQSTITGVAWINFSNLGEGGPLPQGSVIDGRGGGFSDVITAVSEVGPMITATLADVRAETLPRANRLLDSAGDVSAELRTAATTLRDQIEPGARRYHELADAALETAATLRQTADAATGAIGRVDGIMADNRTQIDQTLANLDAAMARVPGLVEEAGRVMQAVESFATEVQGTLGRTEQRLALVLDEGQQLGAAARGVVAGNRGRIDLIIQNVRSASQTMDLAMTEIRRSPWRLMYRPDARQREAMDVYDAARAFAVGAADLQAAAVAIQDAAQDPQINEERLRELLLQLEQRHEAFRQIEQQLIRRLQ